MPKNINPIRKQIVKENRLQGKSARQSLKEAGYSEASAGHHSNRMSVLKEVDKEILTDAERLGIIDEAWRVVQEGLKKGKVKFTLAQAITTKSMTDKKEVNNLNPEKVIIQYNTQPIINKEVTDKIELT